MANGLRKVIILNPKRPKEKAILDVLDKQDNYAEFIRNVLYQYITNNNASNHDNTMHIVLPHYDNTICTPLSCNDNTMHISLPYDDNDKNNFLINVSDVEDENVNINLSEKENPEQNALDFLKNSF